MADDPENHTVRLLQEMRAEMREMRAEVTGARAEVREGFEDLTTRLNGNTLVLNMAMGLLHDHEQRLEKLETAQGEDA